MENELLNKIEEYNKGGLLPYFQGEPITYNTTVDPSTAAALLNNFSMPASRGFKSFCISNEHTVELMAEHVVDIGLIRDDPAGMEEYIRKELARKLANIMIEEDLINIQTSDDPASMTTKVRARIKIVQE